MKCNSIFQKSNMVLSPSTFLNPRNVHRTVHTRIDVCIVLYAIYELSLPCMRAKPGKMPSSPKMVRVIHSASTPSVEYRKHYRYMLKLAIRGTVDDMVGILESGYIKATTFLIGEIERLFDGQPLDGGKTPGWAAYRKADKSGTFYLISDLSVTCAQNRERYSHHQN